jgi:phage terminase large subunit GpA-like protein
VPKWRRPIVIRDPHVYDCLKEFLSLFKPKEYIKPSAWQELYRTAPRGSPIPGRWRNFEYQIEVFDCFADPEVNSLTLMFASQALGKSSILRGGIMWAIDQNPGTMVVCFPTEANAAHWSKNNFTPEANSCPPVRSKMELAVHTRGSRLGEGGNTILHKTFVGGWMVLGGSNSPAQLAAHTARWTLFDEIDRYPESAGEEGDVITLCEQRSFRHPEAFSVKTSTPTLTEMSRIATEMESTDYRKWFVSCPQCRNEFVIMWKDVRWPKTVDEKTGRKIHQIEEAYIECPKCEAKFDDAARAAMVRKGRWIATRPENKGARGYWANAFIVLGPCRRGFTSWLHYLVDRFFRSEKLGLEGRKTFQNLILAETFTLETLPPPDFANIMLRREEYPEHDGEIIVAERCLVLTAGVDVQHNRLECEILGHGVSGETWGIAFKSFRGNTELPDVFDELDEFLLKKWQHASGHMIWPAAVCVDSSDKPTQPYAYIRRVRRAYWFAVKGTRGYTAQWVKRSGRREANLLILAVDGPKERLYSALNTVVEYGPSYQHFPINPQCGYDEEYFKQLTAEKMVKGAAAPYFVRIHSRPNHALDARIYALAALETLPNIAWDKIRANFAKPPVGAESAVGETESGVSEEQKPQTVAVAPPPQTVAPTKPAIKPFGVPRRILPGRGWLPPR